MFELIILMIIRFDSNGINYSDPILLGGTNKISEEPGVLLKSYFKKVEAFHHSVQAKFAFHAVCIELLAELMELIIF